MMHRPKITLQPPPGQSFDDPKPVQSDIYGQNYQSQTYIAPSNYVQRQTASYQFPTTYSQPQAQQQTYQQTHPQSYIKPQVQEPYPQSYQAAPTYEAPQTYYPTQDYSYSQPYTQPQIEIQPQIKPSKQLPSISQSSLYPQGYSQFQTSSNPTTNSYPKTSTGMQTPTQRSQGVLSSPLQGTRPFAQPQQTIPQPKQTLKPQTQQPIIQNTSQKSPQNAQQPYYNLQLQANSPVQQIQSSLPAGYSQTQTQPKSLPLGYQQPQTQSSSLPLGYSQPQTKPGNLPLGYSQPNTQPSSLSLGFSQPPNKTKSIQQGQIQLHDQRPSLPSGYSQPQQIPQGGPQVTPYPQNQLQVQHQYTSQPEYNTTESREQTQQGYQQPYDYQTSYQEQYEDAQKASYEYKYQDQEYDQNDQYRYNDSATDYANQSDIYYEAEPAEYKYSEDPYYNQKYGDDQYYPETQQYPQDPYYSQVSGVQPGSGVQPASSQPVYQKFTYTHPKGPPPNANYPPPTQQVPLGYGARPLPPHLRPQQQQPQPDNAYGKLKVENVRIPVSEYGKLQPSNPSQSLKLVGKGPVPPSVAPKPYKLELKGNQRDGNLKSNRDKNRFGRGPERNHSRDRKVSNNRSSQNDRFGRRDKRDRRNQGKRSPVQKQKGLPASDPNAYQFKLSYVKPAKEIQNDFVDSSTGVKLSRKQKKKLYDKDTLAMQNIPQPDSISVKIPASREEKEEVVAWIQDRKKNFPTKANIQAKKDLYESIKEQNKGVTEQLWKDKIKRHAKLKPVLEIQEKLKLGNQAGTKDLIQKVVHGMSRFPERDQKLVYARRKEKVARLKQEGLDREARGEQPKGYYRPQLDENGNRIVRQKNNDENQEVGSESSDTFLFNLDKDAQIKEEQDIQQDSAQDQDDLEIGNNSNSIKTQKRERDTGHQKDEPPQKHRRNQQQNELISIYERLQLFERRKDVNLVLQAFQFIVENNFFDEKEKNVTLNYPEHILKKE